MPRNLSVTELQIVTSLPARDQEPAAAGQHNSGSEYGGLIRLVFVFPQTGQNKERLTVNGPLAET